MKITSISDLHGEYPELPGGDLLIVAGDLTGSDKAVQYDEFGKWLRDQDYRYKVFIGGNHDGFIEKHYTPMSQSKITYLCDSGTKFEGLKIWGSPYSPLFPGVNPHCKAFMKSESVLADKFALIPDDIDILITHCPPLGILDSVPRDYYACYGSMSLKTHLNKLQPPLHIFGHIHAGYGHKEHEWPITGMKTLFVNAAHMDEDYEPVNKPIELEYVDRQFRTITR